MTIGDITLSASTRANLTALQKTTSLLSTTQQNLSTGKTVNSASDNATAYFASAGFLNSANNLSTIKSNLSTALEAVSSFDNSIADAESIVNQLQGLATQALGTTDTGTRAGLASQFNALATQLDTMINDATFNGTNLLNSTSSSLVVYFNAANTTSLTIAGVNITSAGLLGGGGTIPASNQTVALTGGVIDSADIYSGDSSAFVDGGNLVFSDNFGFSPGTVTVASGTLNWNILDGNTNPSGTMTITGGSFDVSSSSSGSITLSSGTLDTVELGTINITGGNISFNITTPGSTGGTIPGGDTASNAWARTADIQFNQSYLLTALSTLTTDAANFGGNATLLQTRQDFTSNLITSLQNASSDLVTADSNTEGANMQALQAQDSLGIVSLGVSGTLEQAILKIL